MKKLARGKVQVNHKTLTCRYCATFRKTSNRNIKDAVRLCPSIRKWVGSDDKACKRFRPSKLFWCDQYGYWITLNECDNRRMPGTMFDNFKNLKCRNSCKRQKFQVDRVIRYSEEYFAKVPSLKKKLERKPMPEKKRVLERKGKPERSLKRRTT